MDLVDALARLVGPEDVDLSEAGRVAYARDFWPLAAAWFVKGRLAALPEAVVWPETPEEVAAVLRLAAERGVPVTPYGAGSGVMGGAVPVASGIALDLKKLNRIRRLDPDSLVAEVEAGVIGQVLEEELNRAGFTCGHVPQSMYASTLGGWIACRAAGQFSTRYGKIEDIVVGLEAVLPSGEIWRSTAVPRASTGPRLDQLLLGSEGTLGVVTAATIRVWPVPEARVGRSYVVPDVGHGLDLIRGVLRRGLRPAVVRLYDETEAARHFADIPEVAGHPMLVVLCEGDRELAELEAAAFDRAAADCAGADCAGTGGAAGCTPTGWGPVEHWLRTRFDVSLSSYLIRGGGLFETIEVASLWRDATTLYAAAKKGIEAVPGTMLVSGHWSHAYPEGVCLYLTVAARPGSGEHEACYRAIWDAAMEACAENGGTISHHHGIGLVRAPYLPRELGPAYEWLRGLKAVADPKGILNPGKMGLSGAPSEPSTTAAAAAVPPEGSGPAPDVPEGFDLKGVTDCAICPNMCRFDCPATRVDPREGVTPSGKARLAYLLTTGRLDWSAEAAELLASCLGCRACAELCPFHDFSLPDSLVALRAPAAAKGSLPAGLAALGRESDRGHPYGEEMVAVADELAATAAALAARAAKATAQATASAADGPVLFFPGCSTLRLRPQAAQASLNLLARSGVPWRLIDPPDLCCGHAHMAAGRPDLAAADARRLREAVAKAVKATGAKDIVTGCPECAVALGRRYPARGMDFGLPVQTMAAFLTERAQPGGTDQESGPVGSGPVGSGPVGFAPPKSRGRLVYHAPCVLARELGEDGLPADLLRWAGYEVVEPEGSTGRATHCCGGGLFYDRVSPNGSGRVAAGRRGELKRAADVAIVSACPFCEERLGAVDFAELLDRAGEGRRGDGH
ncbi:MAG: FAD-binding and (Fe-S)-binding domain-containing protein [Bacillota bacterium]